MVVALFHNGQQVDWRYSQSAGQTLDGIAAINDLTLDQVCDGVWQGGAFAEGFAPPGYDPPYGSATAYSVPITFDCSGTRPIGRRPIRPQ